MSKPVLTKHCTRCGGEFPDEALFCAVCGQPQARTADDPLCGQVLAERYLLIERVGQGSSGTVYRAEHVTLRRKAAVKILHHQLSADEDAIERFRREATTVANIDNEHILEVLDFGRAADGRLYFAMEYLEGETLASVLRHESRLPVTRAVDILVQIGEALMEAHGTGYVHRDLRPRNIFLTRKHGRDDFVKLLDFGLAKLIHPEGVAHQTNLGLTFGDPRYMSPEQARSEPVDRRADIYALGIIGYELLTGEPPFSGGPTFQLLTRHIEEPPRPLSVLRPGLPAPLEQAILKALAKKPDDRFVTVLHMIEALRAAGTAEAAPRAPALAAPLPELRPLDSPPAAAAPAPAAASSGEVPASRTLTYIPQALRQADAAVKRPATGPATPAATPPTDHHDRPPTEASIPTALIARDEPGPAPPTMSRVWFEKGETEDLTDQHPSRESMRREPPGLWARFGLWGIVGVVAAGLVIGALYLGVAPVIAPSAADAGTPVIAPTVPDAGTPAVRPARADAAVPMAVAATASDAAATKPVPPTMPEPKARAQEREHRTAPPVARLPRQAASAPASAPAAPRLTSTDEDAVQQRLALGRDYLRRGAHAKAAAEFVAARELDPRNAEAIAGLGEVAFEQGQYQDASVHLQAAIRLAPRRPGIHVALGNAYYKLGRTKDAIAAFRAALKLDPDHEEARHALEVAEKHLQEK